MSTFTRSRVFKRTLASLLLGALGAVGTSALAQNAPPLWKVVRTSEQPPRSREVLQAHVVRVDLARLRSSNNASFTLLMPDAQKLKIIKSRQEETPPAVVWIGTIAGDPRSSVTLSVGKTIVVGTISSSRGALYRLQYWKNDLHVVELVDPSRLPTEREPRSIARQPSPPPAPAPAPAGSGPGACTDSSQQIDVMVAYTDDALANTPGGTQAMELMIAEAVAQANQSYINSNIQQHLRLVHVVKENYQEMGKIDKDLDALQNMDGVMDDVHALRDTHAADIVVLITESSGEAGFSTVMETVDHSFESHAFAVVRRDSATLVFTFAHELGHIMSARHDRMADSKENSPYAYNHAHAEPVPTIAGVTPWRTIMATTKPCDNPPTANHVPIPCPRVLQWSNPGVNWHGDATGVMDFEDNARTLNNTAATVANFRCSSQRRPNPPPSVDVQ